MHHIINQISLKMYYEVLGLLFALLLWVVWALIITERRRHRQLEKLGRLPPGPRKWPVVGNIFQLGWAPHESFAKLAQTYGPIMILWLGSMSTVVISSQETAREMFKNHDVVLAGRKIYESMKGDHGNEGSLITAQYGPHWRMLRRLSMTEFFVTSRLDASRGVREMCIDRMVKFIEEAGASRGDSVDVGRFFFLMAFNLIGNLMFSKDLLDTKSESGAKFFYHAGKVMEFAGKPNVADFIPILRHVDPQGIRKNTQFHVEKAFEIAGGFIGERMETMKKVQFDDNHGKAHHKRRDFLDVLLEFRGNGTEEPSQFSSRTINVIVFEMFTAGTDTTTSTLEWAMAELLHNPKTLKRVQSELRRTITNGKKLDERDIENLPYLKAVIKETLRLHPPLPFLVPHMAMDTCKMLGYYIPKETQILVNVWAIGRDPKTWEDPSEFKPERFLEPNMMKDYKGQHFEFIPFGSGRRMCPAVPLASRVLPLALGSLLLSFDWVLADGIKPDDMDMTERMGITLRKAVPLKVIPIPFKGPICKDQ
ncbi:iridoid oxidase [Humulus lupulus]|uniref:iridoid oxidase n=1 Tax=Humulus lupulus TaxID=3486 RepID=UPI002B410F8B|nr:iridoid oxidase [Humulus lupulus]